MENRVTTIEYLDGRKDIFNNCERTVVETNDDNNPTMLHVITFRSYRYKGVLVENPDDSATIPWIQIRRYGTKTHQMD